MYPNDYDEVIRAREKSLHLSLVQTSQSSSLHKNKVDERGSWKTTSPKISGKRSAIVRASSNTNFGGLLAAQNILEKFGWKPGTGLGKNKQGMTAALTVQKIDAR